MNCNSDYSDVFDKIDQQELEMFISYQKSKDDVQTLKNVICKLSVKNQKLLEQVNDLEYSIDNKVSTINRIKNATLDLCSEIVNYVDIEKLRNDLETMNFTSSVRDLLEYISGLRPYKNDEVKNE